VHIYKNISSTMAENVDDPLWIKHFEDFCASDDLSIDKLRRMTEGITLDVLHNSSFLHRVCLNKNVTLEIVEYLLHLYPQALNDEMSMEIDHGVIVLYPLHLACYNEKCPNEVIQLLLERLGDSAAKQLHHICTMDFDWGNTDIDLIDDYEYGGTPLHYYLSRTSNVDINIVKQLVVNSRLLLYIDVKSKCTPIHIIMHNRSIGYMFDVVKYLAEKNPSSLLRKDEYEQNPLCVACKNEFMTAKIIEILLRVCPDSLYQPNYWGGLPIHNLCVDEGDKIDDEVAMEVLDLLLTAQPDLVTRTTDEGDELPVHKAATNRSPAFCKILMDAYPESVRRVDSDGSLPFHRACYEGCPATVEYLFGLYPESLHLRDNNGYLPIHLAALSSIEKYTAETVQFLLLHDPECLSKPIVSDFRGDQYMQGNGALPLHIVCSNGDLTDIQLLFDLYPEAILVRNWREQLPIDIIREKLVPPYTDKYGERIQKLINFLSPQMTYAWRARDENDMRTPVNGMLPLHNAIRKNAPLGTIKLLVKGNPEAINISDNINSMLPLGIASEVNTVGVVNYLAELVPDCLNSCDMNKNFLLHHACRGGNCKVIQYLLERPVSSASVAERNVDDMLPIHLCCKFVNKQEEEEKDTPEYTETIWRLLTSPRLY